MKILFISPKIPYPTDDGGKVTIARAIENLNRLGHSIHFICYSQNVDVTDSYKTLSKYCIPHIVKYKTSNNLLKMFINLFSVVPYNVSKYKTDIFKKELISLLESETFDIVHVNNIHLAWTVDVIKKRLKIPVVLRQENVEMMIMKRFAEKHGNPFIKLYANLQYKKFIKYEPKFCGKFDKVMILTKEDEKIIKKLNPKINSEIIPVGIDESLLKLSKNNPKPFSIVHIGSLNWYPNFDSLNWFLNRIFPKIICALPQVKLYVYGGGPIDKISIPMQVRDNVIIKGFVNNFFDEILSKDLAVVPLRIGSGIRVKILELLAAGQNIITTSIGKEGIDVENDKHLIVADGAENFHNAVIDYFNGKYNKEKLIQNGKLLISEKYTWRKIILQSDKLYKTLINS